MICSQLSLLLYATYTEICTPNNSVTFMNYRQFIRALYWSKFFPTECMVHKKDQEMIIYVHTLHAKV